MKIIGVESLVFNSSKQADIKLWWPNSTRNKNDLNEGKSIACFEASQQIVTQSSTLWSPRKKVVLLCLIVTCQWKLTYCGQHLNSWIRIRSQKNKISFRTTSSSRCVQAQHSYYYNDTLSCWSSTKNLEERNTTHIATWCAYYMIMSLTRLIIKVVFRAHTPSPTFTSTSQKCVCTLLPTSSSSPSSSNSTSQ